ncbi:VHS domain-containing At3g16270 [Olea europaea subsp. europaea]|uniref:VHS domain-containing At3g16270 n=2 Tax=Olea europaea subsp. europaea TaxID=158383 RepID=A0A8S0TLY1_OLEEU|nr:VHS domain-containing At3g16270 [Olea europaea subsp. europaea]
MEQSRRAVESYWRSKMIDGATSDEDKVTPVYKLEEICQLLRSSHVSIVKEVSEFILKRLQHKSPVVKQKALRVIKYAVGKSGTEFRREMQRNSVAVRQLIHYKGEPDPLKADALNKSVRETAQEVLSAIFSSDDHKPASAENSLGSRIQGFGNTNFEMRSEDKKSFLNEVVDIGSSTIKQGLSNLTQSPSLKKSIETGSYRSPNLRRSLTRENDNPDRYEGIGSHGETQSSARISKYVGSGNSFPDFSASQAETTNGDSRSSYSEKTREDKLLETIVTYGGVRLQPTRDALQVFLVEASKLDALSLGHALELKLQSPLWQVRMKAISVLEAILRKADDEHFSVIASYFSDNKDVVVKCSESPQASLREKANKVLSLLGGELAGCGVRQLDKSVKAEPVAFQMPNLIDTGDSDDLLGVEESNKVHSDQIIENPATSAAPLIDDIFGDSFRVSQNTNEHKYDDDPFADVSFHTKNDKDHAVDLFSGMTVDKSIATDAHVATHKTGPGPFDILSSNSEASQDQGNSRKDVNDLMAGLSINGNDPFAKLSGISAEKHAENVSSKSNDVFNSVLSSQASGENANPMFPLGDMAYNFPPGSMFNPSLVSQPMAYNAIGNLFAQQQFLAAMSNFQQLGNLQPSAGVSHATGYNGGFSSPFPDVFNPSIATQGPTSVVNDSKKEETKAFDFISDHLTAARDPKRTF